MRDPRAILRGLPELAAALERRIRREISRRQQPGLDLRHVGPAALQAPQSSGASIGGGGDPSDEPAYPESFSPMDASYLVLEANAELSAERVLTAGSGIALDDTGAGGTATVEVDDTVVRTSGDQSIDGTKTFSDPPQVLSCLRLVEQSSTPAGTPTDETWLFARPAPSGLPGGRLFMKDSASAVHDLGTQSRQVFPAATSDVGTAAAAVALPWAAAGFAPTGAVLSPASVSVSSHGVSAGFNFPASGTIDAATGGELFGRWEWTSSFTPGPPIAAWQNTQLAIGLALLRAGGSVSVRTRLRVNDTARISALYLSLNDGSNTANRRNLSLLASLSSNTWLDAELLDINVADWSEQLRVVITAQGTLNSGNTGLTQLDLEWICVEQWAS